MKAEQTRQVTTQAEGLTRIVDGAALGAEADVTTRLRTKAESKRESGLMDAVCERGNLWLAYGRVVKNKGAAGVDGIGVAEFKDHLKPHWPTIKAKLLAGSYQPSPVRRVDIPKPQGGVRTLGIPTLSDRLIQQALHQVLSPIFEAGFSESSYGFRPGRNAHQAVKAARQYVVEGRRVVVDMDLEKFFDRVNHDLLMEKLSKKIDDGRVLRLIRRYLADVLKLTVNATKRAVAPPWKRKFLGYSLTWHKAPRLRIASASLKRLDDKIREVLKGARGRSLTYTIVELNPVLRGWAAYFKLTETKQALEDTDGWIRHKLRCILWRQWKRPYTRAKNLMKAGLTDERAFRSAFNQRGPWWNRGASHMNQAFPKSFFDRLGLVSLLDTTRRLPCVQ